MNLSLLSFDNSLSVSLNKQTRCNFRYVIGYVSLDVLLIIMAFIINNLSVWSSQGTRNQNNCTVGLKGRYKLVCILTFDRQDKRRSRDEMSFAHEYAVTSFSSHSLDCFRNPVELRGFEPLTPCLQGRCSPNWATTPGLVSFLYSLLSVSSDSGLKWTRTIDLTLIRRAL